MRLRDIPRAHLVVAALVCVVLPALTRIDRGVGAAWSMFTSDAQYRLQITATTANGEVFALAPTALAPLLTPAAAAPIAGSEHWRHGELPRLTHGRALEELAHLACRLHAAAFVIVTVEERARPEAPVRTTTARVTCP